MAERLEVYKCDLCGNIVEVIHAGGGELVCCGQPMTLLTENTVDAAKEKHVPVVEKNWGRRSCEGRERCPSHGGKTLYRMDRDHRGRKGLQAVFKPRGNARGHI